MTKGDRIRDLRKARKITQIEMARMLNTTKQTISKYEKNIVTNIPSDRLELIAKILDTTPEYILGWPEKEKEEPAIEEKEKPVEDDGLTESHLKLIDWAKGLSEDQAAKYLQLMQTIVELGK